VTDPGRAVFLSYASQDAEAAKRICDSLRAAGIEVWFDQSELRGGDVWDRQIRQQIHDCRLFIAVVSANTEARIEGYFRREWKLAVDRTHDLSERVAFLVPVVIDSTSEAKSDVPDAFRHIQWTRLPDGNAFPGFVEQIRRLIAPIPASAPPAAATRREFRPAQPPTTTNGPHPAAKVALWVLSGAVALGIAYFVANRSLLSKRAPAQTIAAVVAPAPAPGMLAIPEKSVAVLPFVDMSEKHDQEYFSDGMSEELIDMLTKIPNLRVSARTSSFYFKGRATTISEIAQALGVAYVLEGSVRKSGKTLRITAQLIKADGGYHLWSDTYDRALNDVFKVQDEIANAVVSAFKIKLSNVTSNSTGRTKNTEAYEQYLIGRQFVARTGIDNYRLAEEAFQKALTLDTTFAAAYVGLSDAHYLVQADNGRLASADFQHILELIDRAIELDPNLSDGYSERGVDELEYLGNLQMARADLSRAIALEPSNSVNQRRYSILQRCLGNASEAVTYARKATEIDPLDVFAWVHLGEALMASHRYPEAVDALLKAVQISPDSPLALSTLFDGRLLEGRADEVLGSVDRLRSPILSLPYRSMAQFTLGNEEKSREALDEYLDLIEKQGFSFEGRKSLATIYAWRKDQNKALMWLEREASQGNGGIVCIKSDPFFAGVSDNPRFKALLQKLKLPE
jgi:TolB-like protein